MAEPARKAPIALRRMPARKADDEIANGNYVERWVERPDGSLELLNLPLTPELFLDPQIGDKMIQGRPHSRAVHYLFDVLERWSELHPGTLILQDVKHLLGPGLPGPAPDVSVVHWVPDPDDEVISLDLVGTGIVPCLALEVISASSARIRRTDEVDKVDLYQRVGIDEYVMIDLPRRSTRHRFRVRGLRLDKGIYRPIEPDSQGRVFSETTRLWFGTSAEGDRIVIFDGETGEPWRTSKEEAERAWQESERARLEAERAHQESERARQESERACQEAERARQESERACQEAERARQEAERADREAVARKLAEEEVVRLRAEIERLRGGA